MGTRKVNSAQGKAIVAQAQGESKGNGFSTLLRNFESAYASGDYGVELMELSNAIAFSVLRKLTDPQRKTAQEKDTVSNSGINPAIVQLKRELAQDTAELATLRGNADKAWNSFDFDADGAHAHFNENGDTLTLIDKDALEVVDALAGERLGDGLDIAQEVATALLELAQEHSASGLEWLELPYTVKRVNRKVLIKEQTASVVEEETTPIQEAYRTARRYIANSRATQTDPRNGYSYLEELATDDDGEPLDTVYRRLNKYADMGGYSCMGLYTVDPQTVHDYNDIIARLNLTDRQMQIVTLRMQGYGMDAIASKLGVTRQAIQNALGRVQGRCKAIGFEP